MAEQTQVLVPDIGDFSDVEIIEVLVKEGDRIATEQSLITLESDKATMEIPSPHGGTVKALAVKVGDRVSQGDPILTLDVDAEAEAPPPPEAEPAREEAAPIKEGKPAVAAPVEPSAAAAPAVPAVSDQGYRPPPVEALPVERPAGGKPHASPSVRKFARELGADLTRVTGSGPKGRILKEDVQRYVKGELAVSRTTAGAGAFALPEMPAVDFSQFGPVETKPLSRIKRIAGANLHRSWLHVPAVTQHDEADITELEAFRKALRDEAAARGVKVTMLSFLMKATVAALGAFPDFNASLAPDGEQLIYKRYYHLGVAVDTPNGLVVPVVRDVDRKGLYELAGELGEISARARDGKLKPTEMQGASFTISSLGGIGGTAFTPIVNAPEVAILGVSRSATKPVYDGGQFVPRLMLPLSLTYDHRVIDGAAAARFTTFLAKVLGDIRRLLL